ncbi:small Arf-related GTPase [Dunaliella salina]|uniref:Small Arf-related GTPase n=1 Tax=Dunaliella salina TaxID=3046 RepID=A0ABQ7GL99_DUNSA|nr:small Arf-related GTPase [Dunaliella salina]|eukprot:KAF5835391.1 small Arf-related GTPase [Dunaliella salina]
MFTLMYGLWEYLFRKDVYQMLILGLDKAGKTNVLEHLKTMYTTLVGLDPGKILPTVGLNVGRLDAKGQSIVLWDLGGQPALQSIWDKYYAESHAVIYVVDAANPARFAESKAAFDRMRSSSQLAEAPLLVMANKQDLEGAVGVPEISEFFGIGKTVPPDAPPMKVVPVCAHTGQGLKESIEWLVHAVRISPRLQRLRVSSA